MSVWFPHVGAHSVSWIFVHVVWATHGREPTIEPSVDGPLERELGRLVTARGARMHAFGAHDDHLHVLVQLPPTLAVSTLVNHAKGASSYAFRESGLSWQAGYWVESVSRRALSRATQYVRDQRSRHATGFIDEAWSRANASEPRPPPTFAPTLPEPAVCGGLGSTRAHAPAFRPAVRGCGPPRRPRSSRLGAG